MVVNSTKIFILHIDLVCTTDNNPVESGRPLVAWIQVDKACFSALD